MGWLAQCLKSATSLAYPAGSFIEKDLVQLQEAAERFSWTAVLTVGIQSGQNLVFAAMPYLLPPERKAQARFITVIPSNHEMAARYHIPSSDFCQEQNHFLVPIY